MEQEKREPDLLDPFEPDHSVFYSHDVLAKKWKSGDFERLLVQLHNFILRHKEHIFDIANDVDAEFPDIDERSNLIASIRALVIANQGVNPAAEMGDQIKEINREIWYRGEEGETDRKKIAQEWTRQYASQWRSARLQELLFLIDSDPDSLIALLRQKSEK